MNVLVTGGAGFIGSNFVRYISSKGCIGDKTLSKIIVLDKLTYSSNLKNIKKEIDTNAIEFIKGDICDGILVNRIVKGVNLIINFAAETHVDRSIDNSSKFIKTNVLGAETLIRAALSSGVEKFIQISTDEVYGSIEFGSWDENCKLEPNSPYSASKASADLIVNSYFKTYGMDVRTTRCCNNYGPGQYPEKLIPLAITNLFENKKVPIYGNGLNIREWIHVNDHCRGIELVVNSGSAGETYNIGSGYELSNIEISKKIIGLLKKDNSMIEYVEDRKGHDFRYSVNSEKIAKIGYEPIIDFTDGLIETISWYRENIDSWSRV